MASLKITRLIDASPTVVFRAVADPRQFVRALSGVTKLEFLSPMECGVGTRFRQSRVINGREMTMDFHVSEYVENKRVRIVNETRGTVWDSLITLVASGPSTELTMQMDARTRPIVPRLLMPLMLRLFIAKSVEKDFDAVKAICETEDRR